MSASLPQRISDLLISLLPLLLSFSFYSVYANSEQEFPVLYKGRYRPAEAYARLWLYDFYHAPNLKDADLSAFHTDVPDPLSLLWSLEILGHMPYQMSPLFWIGSAEMKKLAGLPLTRDRFSYQELQSLLVNQEHSISLLSRKLIDDWATLLAALKEFERLHEGISPIEQAFRNRFAELQAKTLPSKEIEHILEQEYPLAQRLRTAGTLFKSLPSRYKEGEWLPLKALKVQIYQPSTHILKEVENFTSFSNEQFIAIRQAYFALERAYAQLDQKLIQANQLHLANALQQAYQSLAGRVIQEAHGKQLNYPTLSQLQIEALYVNYPWITLLILLYGIGACLLLIFYQLKLCTPRSNGPLFQGDCGTPSARLRDEGNIDLILPSSRNLADGVPQPLQKAAHLTEGCISNGFLFAILFIGLAILCHTALLAIRCYILGRPPVSNMFETVIYVPWVAACTSLLFPTFRRQPLVLLAACLTAIGLLLILEVTDLNQSLDQVQAVLDSQFWLMIHVLLVVGSYGIFILGAIIGHFYLALFMMQRKETTVMKMLAPIILQTLYGGTALLIAGTILGGIWAAQSWGRFWDWDPKESWAFISICFYLIWIHAYRFHRIASFGLAIGVVGGLLAISFTWYGVNYILGTGLHSYGFGSGGEGYYYAFFATECLFMTAALWSYSSRQA